MLCSLSHLSNQLGWFFPKKSSTVTVRWTWLSVTLLHKMETYIFLSVRSERNEMKIKSRIKVTSFRGKLLFHLPVLDFLFICSPSFLSQVVLSSAMPQQLLPPLTKNSAVPPPLPLLLLKMNPLLLLPASHQLILPIQPLTTWIRQSSQNRQPVLPQHPSFPPPDPLTPDLSQNLRPHRLQLHVLLHLDPRLLHGLPSCQTTRPLTFARGTLTQWPCWGGRCLSSR